MDQVFVDEDWDEIVVNQTGDSLNFPDLHWIFRVHLELFGYVSQDGQGFINPPTLMLQHWKFIDPLPVLDSFESGMDTGDSESIHSLLDNANQELGE